MLKTQVFFLVLSLKYLRLKLNLKNFNFSDLIKEKKEVKIQERLSVELGKKVDIEKPVDVEDKGPIGIDVASLSNQNILSFEKSLKNDPDLDEILRRFEKMAETREKPFASVYILELMKRVKYDPRYSINRLKNWFKNNFLNNFVNL